MKFDKFLMLVVLVAGCSSAQPEQESDGNYLTISGTVGYPQKSGYIILEEFLGTPNQTRAIDTFSVDDKYKFSKKVRVDNPGYFRLNFYDKQAVNVILSKDDIVVNVDGNDARGFVEIKGSSEIDFIKSVQQINQAFQSAPEIQTLNSEFVEASKSKDQVKMEELRDKYFSMEKELKQRIVAKIDSMGASLGVVEILRSGKLHDKDEHFDVFRRQADLLQAEMPNSQVAQDFIKEVESMKTLAIGQVAPDLELPNPDGELVKLSSLRGKYVLLDFWAKWCGPCRMENPNVVRMYNKYNAQGFEVYGVSFDRRREDWLQAIEQDGLHWTQVSDLKYWNSEAAKIYNVTAIPFALLLDPDGKIIGKNLRGQQLAKKLAEIFDKG